MMGSSRLFQSGTGLIWMKKESGGIWLSGGSFNAYFSLMVWSIQMSTGKLLSLLIILFTEAPNCLGNGVVLIGSGQPFILHTCLSPSGF